MLISVPLLALAVWHCGWREVAVALLKTVIVTAIVGSIMAGVYLVTSPH